MQKVMQNQKRMLISIHWLMQTYFLMLMVKVMH
jgi:hypothetical protein